VLYWLPLLQGIARARLPRAGGMLAAIDNFARESVGILYCSHLAYPLAVLGFSLGGGHWGGDTFIWGAHNKYFRAELPGSREVTALS